MTNRLLYLDDYKTQIQNEDLFQIIGREHHSWDDSFSVQCWEDHFDEEGLATLRQAEQMGQSELIGFLKSKYETDEIFSNSTYWNSGTTYFGKSLVKYSAPYYNSGTTYNYNDRFEYRDKIWTCILSGGTSATTPAFSSVTYTNYSQMPIVNSASGFSGYSGVAYSFVCLNKDLFYANLPFEEYKIDKFYHPGEFVWYKNNIFVALQKVRGKTPADSNNLELVYGIPGLGGGGFYAQGEFGAYGVNEGTIPGKKSSAQSWANQNLVSGLTYVTNSGTSVFSFSAVTPDNTTFWTAGENRPFLLKMYLIDVILYHLHSSVNPRNIPLLREDRYKAARKWLDEVNRGRVFAELPIKIPVTNGGSFIWGGQPKSDNIL
jgi:hypothetical protein